MKRVIVGVLFTAVLLAGCAGPATTPSFFVLDDGDAAARSADPLAQPVLVVDPVRVADFLRHSGIVYQTAPHRVVIANDNRWAAPIAAQLTDALSGELAQKLTGLAVRGDAPGAPDNAAHLKVRVDQFMGHFDGRAHIAGRWQLLGADGEPLAGADFKRTVALAVDGYPALVDSLSRGWRATAAGMAPAIANALDPP